MRRFFKVFALWLALGFFSSALAAPNPFQASAQTCGVKCDGVTDDSAAMQKAVNAAPSVTLPAGDCVMASTVTLPNIARIYGAGGSQESVLGRRTRIIYTGTSGWAFDYQNSVGSTHFYGEFEFSGLKIEALSISGDTNGGAIKIGSSDTANFSTYENISRVSIHDVWITGASLKGVGIYLIKVFDAHVTNAYVSGFNYGIWAYGSDIATIGRGTRLQSNGTHVRSTLNGTFSGSLKLDHADLIAATYQAVWLEGSVAPIMRDNYIEQTTGTSTAQTGTVTQADLTTTVTGAGTTFLTQLADSAFNGDKGRVLLKVGSQYRRVTAVANDGSLTVDTPFLASFSAQAWSIVKGYGVLASSVDRLYSSGNRIDVTSTAAVVPRGYYSTVAGRIDDIALTNANQGPLIIAGNNPGPRLYVWDSLVQNGMNDAQPGTHYYRAPTDGSRQRPILQDMLIADTLRPGIVYNQPFWFEQTGGALESTPSGTGANANGAPVMYVATSGSGGDISAKLPARMLDKFVRIRFRAKAIGADSFIQWYAGATLGATTSALNSFTLATASNWTEFEYYGVGPTTANPYLTITKNTTSLQWEFVAIQVVAVGDQVPRPLAGASAGAFANLIAATTLGPTTYVNAGAPGGVVFGSPGDFCINTNGGAATTLYVKESGSVTTAGWVGK